MSVWSAAPTALKVITTNVANVFQSRLGMVAGKLSAQALAEFDEARPSSPPTVRTSDLNHRDTEGTERNTKRTLFVWMLIALIACEVSRSAGAKSRKTL
jgi:hypothetical protein